MKKNTIKVFGIIALLAIIVFSMTACDDGGGVTFPSGFIGTWRRESSSYTNTLTFTSTTLKASNQNYYWELQSISGDMYTIKSSRSTYTGTNSFRLTNGKLVISGDDGTGEDNWNGNWIKTR